jgi:hypothetical protein
MVMTLNTPSSLAMLLAAESGGIAAGLEVQRVSNLGAALLRPAP